jgi:16S rRNA (guanine527-N7)-methyltransferase
MEPNRIAELLAPFLGSAHDRLNVEDFNLISTYINLLRRWNQRVNLTAVRNEDEIVTRHFGESLFTAVHLFPDARSHDWVNDNKLSLADLGSGAGFPGIPIKMWSPNLALTLIEANHKKAAFLGEVSRALRLTNVNIESARAETIPQSFETVTVRAVEHFGDILPVANRLIADSGRLALLISRPQVSEAQAVLPRLEWQDFRAMPGSESRVLFVGSKKPSNLNLNHQGG